MEKATLVLEGGATRGVFTSGVLDYMMEKEFYVSDVIGVSAGSCNAVDYVSRQIGRTRDCMIHKEKKYSFYNGIRKTIKERSLMDMNMIFDTYPREIFPFDFDIYFKSEINCEIVTTNCLTGQAEYMTEKEDGDRLMKICRASSSMPLVSPIVNVDEIPYLDGGIADSIPIRRALEKENEKIIVILTRNAGYRKKIPSKALGNLYRRAYKSYPQLVRAILRRNQIYNRTLNEIHALEEKGRIFVLRPEEEAIGRMEKKYEVLEGFYEHGYHLMERDFDKMTEYLGK